MLHPAFSIAMKEFEIESASYGQLISYCPCYIEANDARRNLSRVSMHREYQMEGVQ